MSEYDQLALEIYETWKRREKTVSDMIELSHKNLKQLELERETQIDDDGVLVLTPEERMYVSSKKLTDTQNSIEFYKKQLTGERRGMQSRLEWISLKKTFNLPLDGGE